MQGPLLLPSPLSRIKSCTYGLAATADKAVVIKNALIVIITFIIINSAITHFIYSYVPISF
jgi:hypothetical protein